MYPFPTKIDWGRTSIIVLVGECVKLWIMWPPTKENLELYYKNFTTKSKLIRLGKDFEEPTLILQDTKKAVVIPSGYIHSTVTLRGGVVLGKDITTIEAFPRADDILCREVASFNGGLPTGMAEASLEAFVIAARSSTCKEEAARRFCKRRSLIRTLPARKWTHDLRKMVEGEFGVVRDITNRNRTKRVRLLATCMICRLEWEKHPVGQGNGSSGSHAHQGGTVV